MIRAAIDIGTNSMRLLIVDDDGNDVLRVSRVTGLGRGVDTNRRLDPAAVERTLRVLDLYGRLCDVHHVQRRRAVATSASRDAENRDDFLGRAATVLGTRPEVIPGESEARLAYSGAVRGRADDALVVDIGGGSTEFVWGTGQASVDIGSVRLTDRLLPDRPVDFETVETAIEHVEGLLSAVAIPPASDVIGVAGTWTSLAAISRERDGSVDGERLERIMVERLVGRLSGMTVEDTAALPGLDPARAPVILAGAVIAREAMRRLEVLEVTVSERDLLDGIVAEL
ncbi:MAG: Ppx/GppA phosphatase family protein [Acidimicrobiia bacterium]|nr:Ppx/GppA phosphatase family protein [Acidimicrobiia bacterium]